MSEGIRKEATADRSARGLAPPGDVEVGGCAGGIDGGSAGG